MKKMRCPYCGEEEMESQKYWAQNRDGGSYNVPAVEYECPGCGYRVESVQGKTRYVVVPDHPEQLAFDLAAGINHLLGLS